MEKYIIVCEVCGSTNVETLAWVDVNSLVFKDNFDGSDKQDNYCNNCNQHVYLTSLSEWEKTHKK